MKIVKILLIVLGVIIAIPLILAIFIKKDYSVEREIIISKPKAEVFNYIKLLKNQENFSKWAKMDPYMTREYRGVDGEVGFISAWQSKNPDVGKGEQEIIKIEDGSRVDYELRFIEPFTAKDKAYMITEMVDENSTKVKWGFNGHMNYPGNLMLLFMDFEKMIGGDFDEGLNNLKSILESRTETPATEDESKSESQEGIKK
ncbi:MAG: SRPBCC family protein [Leptospiraceae bacterium]|nr:SRPBCC family protein [Leptospiraceae bacterium]